MLLSRIFENAPYVRQALESCMSTGYFECRFPIVAFVGGVYAT